MTEKIVEGLKLFVPGGEVKILLDKKAAYHRDRAAKYQQTYDKLVEILGPLTEEDLPKLSSSGGGDDRSKSKDGAERHTNNAVEDEFMSAHIDVSGIYELDTTDLHRLGVLKNRY